MRNMAVGTISAWWITLTTLLTYALKDLETESSTGLLSTILGYVRLKKNGSFTVCSCNVIQYAVSESDCQCLVIKSIAVEGYETGEHAPGLKLKGTGAYKAAHHIIKVGLNDLCPVLLINLIIYHNFQLLVLILWLEKQRCSKSVAVKIIIPSILPREGQKVQWSDETKIKFFGIRKHINVMKWLSQSSKVKSLPTCNQTWWSAIKMSYRCTCQQRFHVLVDILSPTLKPNCRELIYKFAHVHILLNL